MTSIAQLRDGLKATIEAATNNIHVYARVPNSVEPKCVVIVPQRSDARTMGRGVTEYVFGAVCVASKADSEHGQQVLDEMLDAEASQILAAIESDKTLGISGVRAHVAGWDDYGTSEFGDTAYYTATIPVVVHVTK